MNVKIVFNFDSQEEARVIADSIHPEIEKKIPKTDVKIFVDKKICSLFIESKDVSSLRAACNSYLRWINTALSVKRTV